jgi:4-hydroxybenzoyl-CoA thioesterase
MFINRKRITVEFGDCDPAEIVFFANYFRWFDDCTTALFLAAGFPIRALFRTHGIVGIPIVDARARFIAPSTFGDKLEVESGVTEWHKSSFVISHKFYREGKLVLDGTETRVWAAQHPTEANRMKGVPLPKEVIAKLSQKGKRGGRKAAAR